MFRNKYYRIALALAVLSAPVLTGCGSSGGGTPPPVGGVGGYQNGYYWGNGTCVPINSPVGFGMQNIYMDSANIVGGNFPYSGQSVGQVYVGQGGGGGQFNRSTYDGNLSLNLASPYQQQWQPYNQYPQYTYPQNPQYNYYGYNTGVVSGTGTLQISPSTQQEIYYSVSTGAIQIPGYGGYYGNPYGGMPGAWNPNTPPGSYNPPTGYQQQICVSSIAMNLGRWGSTLYGGKLYVYLNNTNHGIILNF